MEPETNKPNNKLKPVIAVWFSIPLYILASFLAVNITALANLLLNPYFENASVYVSLVRDVMQWSVLAFIATFLSFLFLKYVDRVAPGELGLSFKGKGKDCVWGIVFAVVLYAIGFSISLLTGAVSISAIHVDFIVLLLNLMMFFAAAWYEEVVCRGYIQGRLMTKMNKFLALAVTSVIFSLLHLGNPNLGILPLINLFLAGVMLGASYLYTRNLWFPIVLHTFWNWIQGPVLGYGVSGTKNSTSLLTLSLPENNIINGGAFGFEGSVICTILLVVASGAIIWWGENNIHPHNFNDI